MADSSLQDQLRRRISREGPLAFDEFLEAVLYGPSGYYATRAPGRGSDYRTAPSETPWFGKLVLRQLESTWHRLGCPKDFTVAEFGPGTGDLAAAAIGYAGDPLARVLRWCMVEPFEAIARLQQRRLSELRSRVEWVSSLENLEPFSGVVLANEVLDNFPFRVLEVTESGIQEVGVGLADGQLAEVFLPSSAPKAEEAQRALQYLEPGDRFEIRPAFDQWSRNVARVLKSGYLMVIDYGDTEPAIWLRRPAGTLVTYRDEQLGVDPLAHIGGSDITAHVNFSALQRFLHSAGLTSGFLVTQREWLETLGLKQVVQDLRTAEKAAAAEGDHARWLGLVAERSRVQAIAASGGLGAHRALIASTPDLAR
jgi:SAM-dependent MidA family methyltransferase